MLTTEKEWKEVFRLGLFVGACSMILLIIFGWGACIALGVYVESAIRDAGG